MRKYKKLLTMDELHARPCEVDGRPAMFHHWIEEDRALLKIAGMYSSEDRRHLVDDFQLNGICAPGTSVDVIRQTFALVEYLDGTIAKVDPLLIRFTDKKEPTS